MFIVLPAIATMMILTKPICALISGNYEFEQSLGYTSSPYILMTLCFMMLTYALGDMIYGQILLPQKKEKHYLIAIGGGTILNIALSLIFGILVYKDSPSLGVAIGTMITDTLVLAYLLFVSWDYIKKPLLNINNLKILIATGVIVGLTFALLNPMYKLGLLFNGGVSVAMIIQIASIVLIDAIVYVLILYFSKENIVRSVFKRKSK